MDGKIATSDVFWWFSWKIPSIYRCANRFNFSDFYLRLWISTEFRTHRPPLSKCYFIFPIKIDQQFTNSTKKAFINLLFIYNNKKNTQFHANVWPGDKRQPLSIIGSLESKYPLGKRISARSNRTNAAKWIITEKRKPKFEKKLVETPALDVMAKC